MLKKILVLLLVATNAQAANTFFRAHDANSVILGPICTYGTTGADQVDIDFNTTSLTIRIYASGDGVDSAFSYSAGNIDDYDGTPPAWGNPTTSAVEVEDDDDCIRLHIRDEVLATAGATEWTIIIDDGGSTFMTWEGQVLALADSTQVQADVTTALQSADLDDLADAIVAVQGTADSGSTTTLVDSALTQADDYWNDYMLVVEFSGGTKRACIIDFVASSDTLTVYPAFPSGVGTEQYAIVAEAACRNYYR
jgi:hypothetical protein